MATGYRGRFAPSPTGALHFGSLVSAMASYLEARVQQGQWLIRIDDVDETRCVAESEQQILTTLDCLGFEWDEQVARQTDNKSQYKDALAQLDQKALIYGCECSRKTIASNAKQFGNEGAIYPRTCANKGLLLDGHAVRIHVPDQTFAFNDAVYGLNAQNLDHELGDFVVRRVDGYTAYQLAVVVDDHLSGITHVVRGADLLWSTPRQMYIQTQLGYAQPDYMHIPLVLDSHGRKLSKSDDAHPIDKHRPMQALLAAWQYLNQQTDESVPDSVEHFWPWAMQHWTINQIKGASKI